MGVQGVNGMAIAATASGALLIWSGLKGRSVTTSLKSLISGQAPSGVVAHGISLVDYTGTDSGSTVTSSGNPVSDSGIANDALSFRGAGYVWGGAPGRGRGNWDCSSFVNWVVGHDLKMAIPGYKAGSYTGSVHGPTTLQWRFFGHPVKRADVQAGDIVVWLTHMGIAIGSNSMISAENPSQGTQVAAIDGFIRGEPVTYRRL